MNPALDTQAPVLALLGDPATHGGRSHDASDADAAVVRTQESNDLGAFDWTRVDASGSPDDTLRRAQAVLG
jgi:predicted kinase